MSRLKPTVRYTVTSKGVHRARCPVCSNWSARDETLDGLEERFWAHAAAEGHIWQRIVWQR